MPQLLYFHLISHHLHYTEINEVYISRAARAFGLSLIGIFIPIYLYNLGYGLPVIALFYIIAHSAHLLMTPVTAALMARFGAKHLMAFGQLWAMAFIVLLTFADSSTLLLLLAAIVWGVDLAIFWPAHHLNMSYVRTQGKTSRQIGTIFMILSVTSALGPLLGGVIATQFGIQYAFLAALILLLVAAYVSMQTPEQGLKATFNWRQMLHGWKLLRRDATANAANGLQTSIAISIWPLFIFLFLGTYQTVGLVVSFSLVVSIVVIYFIAVRGDQGKNLQQIHLGTKGSALVHLVRPFAQTFGVAVGINILHEVASNLYKIPFVSYYYEHASSARDRLAYIVKMELASSAGMIVSWLIVLVLALLLPLNVALISAFAVAAVAVLFNTKIATSTDNAVLSR